MGGEKSAADEFSLTNIAHRAYNFSARQSQGAIIGASRNGLGSGFTARENLKRSIGSVAMMVLSRGLALAPLATDFLFLLTTNRTR